MNPQLFHLQRDRDISGVSGTGRVANGVLWPDGTVTLRWLGDRPSTVHWERLADAIAVHGHGGATRLVWATPQPPAVDQTPRRDRIADTLAEADGWVFAPGFKEGSPTYQGFLKQADAVLAVLPAPADQAATLTQAERRVLRYALSLVDTTAARGATELSDDDEDALASLRRMADEAPPTEAHEPLRQWRVEILDGDEWMPASGLRRDRSQVAEQLRMSSERRPLWNDGTRVQRRLVRETTTYTVEQPAAGARQDGAQPS